MLQGEHSATLKAFIKLPFVIKIFVLAFLAWLFYIGFTVVSIEFDFITIEIQFNKIFWTNTVIVKGYTVYMYQDVFNKT